MISFALPLLQVGLLKPSVEQLHGDYLLFSGAMPPPPIAPQVSTSVNTQLGDINWMYVSYLVIALGFALKLSFSIYKIIKIWVKANKYTAGDIKLIEVNGESTAFSFFNLLFIHPSLANQPAVLKHEMVHIKQKHSFDVIFFELIQIICWFNPILHFIKKDIKLLHEFIADELTTNADVQKHEYALFLIQNSFGLSAQPITNQIFNQSILKRRINMLNKKRTAGWARLRLLLAVPLTGAMLCISTMAFTKDYGYVDLLPEKSEFVAPIQENPKVENIKNQNQLPFWNKNQEKNYFLPSLITGKDGKVYSVDKRYILINGKKVSDLNTFYGLRGADKIIKLNGTEAVKKYGNSAKYGAVEITGSKIILLKTAADGPPPPKMDQVKFPPTYKPKAQNRFIVYYRMDRKTGKQVRGDLRYIIVNGKPAENQNKFYGAENTESVTYLNPEEATKRYGSNGKYGAVEITGSNNMAYFDEIVPPPPPQVETVKFPPPQPIFKTEQKYFTPAVKKNKETGNLISVDKRYIVINGNPVEDNTKFYGVTKSETVTYLNSTEAIKVYGEEKGKYGAVEIHGSNVQFNKSLDQIKFPPPIVKADQPKKSIKTPPPSVEPPPPGYKAKKGQIKFPPPPAEPPNTKKVKMIEGDPTSSRIEVEMKKELQLAKKTMVNGPKPTTKEKITTLNKIKVHLEERLKESQNDITKGYIKNQIAYIQLSIAKETNNNNY